MFVYIYGVCYDVEFFFNILRFLWFGFFIIEDKCFFIFFFVKDDICFNVLLMLYSIGYGKVVNIGYGGYVFFNGKDCYVYILCFFN